MKLATIILLFSAQFCVAEPSQGTLVSAPYKSQVEATVAVERQAKAVRRTLKKFTIRTTSTQPQGNGYHIGVISYTYEK